MSNIIVDNPSKTKKTIIRIFFYFLVIFILFLIPIIYKLYLVTYGIEMLLFISPFYTIGEFVGISVIVFLAEYYLFVKKKVEIKDKEVKKNMS